MFRYSVAMTKAAVAIVRFRLFRLRFLKPLYYIILFQYPQRATGAVAPTWRGVVDHFWLPLNSNGNVQIMVGQGLAPAGWCGPVSLFRRQQAAALPDKRVCVVYSCTVWYNKIPK